MEKIVDSAEPEHDVAASCEPLAKRLRLPVSKEDQTEKAGDAAEAQEP